MKILRSVTKGRAAVYALGIWLSSLSLLLHVFPPVWAQSGRVPTTPPPVRDAAPEPPRREQPSARPGSAADSRADTYRLVFATEFTGKESYKLHEERDRKELRRSDETLFANFASQLNKAGAEGYKIKSLISYSVPVAVMKFDEGPYEYDWFNITHGPYFALEGREGKYDEFSNRGFQLFEHSLYRVHCADLHPEYPDTCEACEFEHLFLFEKVKGEQGPVEHQLSISGPSVRKSKVPNDLLEQVNEGLAEGLYPIHLLSRYEIMLGRSGQNEELPAGKPDLLVVGDTSFWGKNNLTGNVNKAAAQGYRLALAGDNMVVMYRPAEQSPPVSYVWLDARKKNFEQKLAELQGRGATYRMPYPSSEGVKAWLIFELPSAAGGQRREYRVLKFDFDVTADAWSKSDPNGKRRVGLTAPSKGTEEALNSLAKQGFVVRDLFVSDKVSVLLERPL
jgi:hypothetical protein